MDYFVYKKIEIIYFNSFGVKQVPKEVFEKFIQHKDTKPNIFRIQKTNLIMCGYFCIRFIDFMLTGKTDYPSLFWPYDFEKEII